ncbi:MAG: BMC domain-containing protein [Ignavibacteriales bacterium]|nr:BMC domain-containing protein [Ignavibacteriales bacterium]
MPLALGLVETHGLVAAIEAADAMAKASSVRLIGKEKTNPALVTIKVVGEVAAVKASVEAGAAAASRVGIVVSTHIIPRPDLQLADFFPEILDEETIAIPQGKIAEEKEEVTEPPVAVQTVNDVHREEKVIAESDKNILTSEAPETEIGQTEPVVNKNEPDVDLKEVLDDTDNETYFIEETDEDDDDLDDVVFESEEYHYDEEEPEDSILEVLNPDEIMEDEDFDYFPSSEVEHEETTGEFTDELTEEDTAEIQQTFVDVFSALPDEIATPETESANFVFEDLFAQAERIEKQKKSSPQTEEIPVQEEKIEELADTEPGGIEDTITDEEAYFAPEIDENFPPAPTENFDSLTSAASTWEPEFVEVGPTEVPDQTSDEVPGKDANSDAEYEELKNKPIDSMNVHQLRRLARSSKSFPIQGREISKANRQELLYYFNSIS